MLQLAKNRFKKAYCMPATPKVHVAGFKLLNAKTLHICNTCCHHFLGSTPAACFLQLELSTLH